jgi:hypothetical protein
MRFSPPKPITWFIAFFLGLTGILLMLGIVKIPPLPSGYEEWFTAAGLVLLLLATVLPGL